ncbi:MAG: glycosyltransferase, partial [Candidatus Theseobacter exili]|nr:glycosyltransferase [Candidatus Theseobacter exili]
MNVNSLTVDVILPIYKPKRFVFATIESVVHQSYPYWHLAIIDDSSEDSMIDLLEEKYKDQSGKISFIRLKK